MKKYFLSLGVGLLTLLFLPYIAMADWSDGLSMISTFGLPNAEVEFIIEGVLLWILRIFIFLAILAFVINGIMFLMAGADQNMAEKAKKGFTISIIGVAVGIAGYVIVNFIDSILIGAPM